MPSEYGNLTLLQSLDLSDHWYLEGHLPRELANLVDLETLYLNDTGMTGCLPAFLGDRFKPNIWVQVASTSIGLLPKVVKKVPGAGKIGEALNKTPKGQLLKGAIVRGFHRNVNNTFKKFNRPILQRAQ